MSSPLPVGTKLGRYSIRSLIGTGGMGEVYLADDTLLRRPTAIKLLIGDYSQKAERLHRFEREAYAASSLNHPNIVTIYEVGSEDGYHFIATEFVDGQSLRLHARISPMDSREVVEVAIQVASALTAAHEAGIIHRDIKPENIMLRRDGYVKVLDFGLAKLTEDSWHHETDAEAATQLMIKTEPGRVMGTVDYMSPEQARGREVDQRTDIFSLGVVIYELAAGVKPFTGETQSDVFAAVLTAEPVPLAQRRPETPAELNRIVTKCLRKNRDERYQSSKELLLDLKSLLREMDFASKLGLTASTSGVAHTTPLTPPPATHSGEVHPTTISELFIKQVKTNPRRSFILFTLLGVALVAAGFGLYRLVKLAGRTETFQNMRLVKLTSSGDVTGRVSVSPDGKYVVFTVINGGEASLWVRQVATSSTAQLVAPSPAVISGVTFSPDGSYVYYTVEESDRFATLYQVAALGGTPRKLIENADGPVSFSPDGSRLAFRRKGGTSELMIANADGSGVKTLKTRPNNELWLAPAWSPDNRVIVAGAYVLSESRARLVEVSTIDGTEKALSTTPWLNVTSLVWLPDTSGLVLVGRDLETKMSQLWLVGYPDGKTRRITNDLGSYSGVSLTADGKTLVSVQNARATNLWVVPNGDANLATKITFETGKDEGLSGLSWTPDGKIVYTARTSGTTDLWIAKDDGRNPVQLTANAGLNSYPNVTPDGRFIAFVSNRSGRNNVWRIDIDGRNPVQLTNSDVGRLSVSPDGKWVFYEAQIDNTSTIWKSSIDGGNPIQLTHEPSFRPIVASDGKTFVCWYGGTNSASSRKLAVVSVEGGRPEQELDLSVVLKSFLVQWDPKGEGLVYVDNRNRIDNLWSQKLKGGPPKQVTDFKSDQIFAFDWSHDGKSVVFARGRDGSDVVMITNFR